MTETYSISIDFSSGVAIGQLQQEIIDSLIVTSLISINTNGDNINIIFISTISGAEKILLDAVVAAHIPGVVVPGLTDINHNLNSTTDPISSDDEVLGYGVGSVWINIIGLRDWTCFDNSTGSAIWKLKTAVTTLSIPFDILVKSLSYIQIGYVLEAFKVQLFVTTSTPFNLKIGTDIFTISTSGVKEFNLTSFGIVEVKKNSSGTDPLIQGIFIF
jgi:hypothetical protein